MDKNYRQALTEVLEVLNHTDKELIIQIPKEFAVFLLENREQDYIPNIDFNVENWEETLREEAKAILAYIYKEYLLTDKEKLDLLNDEVLVQKGEQMLQKYGAEDLFINNPYRSTPTTETTPVEVKASPWYKKIFQSIIRLFK